MGRSETETEGRVSHNETVDSDPVLSTTPEPSSDKVDLVEEQTVLPTASESVISSQTMPNSNTDSVTERKTAENKEMTPNEEIDVMSIPNRTDIVWKNVYLFIYLHIASAYGLYLLVTGQVMWQTIIWGKPLLSVT